MWVQSSQRYIKHCICILPCSTCKRKKKNEKFAYSFVGSLSHFEIAFIQWYSGIYWLIASCLIPLPLSPPLSLSLPFLQSLSSFDSLCVPPPSPRYSCTQYLHISRWGAVSLVAVVVALEYSCLASQHNSEIREPSTVPLNGKISPHRLLYRMHSLLLSFNPLSSPALLTFPSSPLSSNPLFPLPSALPFLQSSLCFSSSSSSPVLSISLNPLSTFIPLSSPFLLSSSRVLVLNTPEPGHGSLGVPGLLI